MDPKLRLADIKIEEESLDNEAGSGKKRYFASDEEFEEHFYNVRKTAEKYDLETRSY